MLDELNKALTEMHLEKMDKLDLVRIVVFLIGYTASIGLAIRHLNNEQAGEAIASLYFIFMKDIGEKGRELIEISENALEKQFLDVVKVFNQDGSSAAVKAVEEMFDISFEGREEDENL